MPVPLSSGQVTVQNGHSVEPRAKPLPGLRREADLRHQHDRLPAEPNHFFNGADVDFRFATAGHAVNEQCLVPPGVQRREYRIERRLLVSVQMPVRLARLGHVVHFRLLHAADFGVH